MKKILITGGAGYVGSKLVPALLELDYSVTVIDLMIYGENVLPNHQNLNIIKGDIRNVDLLNKIIPGHDFLIHLACISNDPSFELNPRLGKSIILMLLSLWSRQALKVKLQDLSMLLPHQFMELKMKKMSPKI